MSVPGGRPTLLRREVVASDGSRVTLRPARSDDAQELVDLRDAVAAEGSWVAATPGERSVTEEHLALASLIAGGGLALVAEVEGTLAGQLSVARRRGPWEAHVGDVAISVAASQRGLGIGRALLETAVDWGRRVGLGKLSLAVFTTNDPAARLYASCGFVEEGVLVRQVRVGGELRDVRLMACHLAGGASA